MEQSEAIHVGIIMDGNGRWATRQGRSRSAGHRAGAAMVRRIVEAAPDAGIGVLTLYAFSADNWRRPKTEVGWLMRLFREYLRVETARCVENGVRLEVIGRRDRVSSTRSCGPLNASSPGPSRPATRSAACSPSWITALPSPTSIS